MRVDPRPLFQNTTDCWKHLGQPEIQGGGSSSHVNGGNCIGEVPCEGKSHYGLAAVVDGTCWLALGPCNLAAGGGGPAGGSGAAGAADPIFTEMPNRCH